MCVSSTSSHYSGWAAGVLSSWSSPRPIRRSTKRSRFPEADARLFAHMSGIEASYLPCLNAPRVSDSHVNCHYSTESFIVLLFLDFSGLFPHSLYLFEDFSSGFPPWISSLLIWSTSLSHLPEFPSHTHMPVHPPTFPTPTLQPWDRTRQSHRTPPPIPCQPYCCTRLLLEYQHVLLSKKHFFSYH